MFDSGSGLAVSLHIRRQAWGTYGATRSSPSEATGLLLRDPEAVDVLEYATWSTRALAVGSLEIVVEVLSMVIMYVV